MIRKLIFGINIALALAVLLLLGHTLLNGPAVSDGGNRNADAVPTRSAQAAAPTPTVAPPTPRETRTPAVAVTSQAAPVWDITSTRGAQDETGDAAPNGGRDATEQRATPMPAAASVAPTEFAGQSTTSEAVTTPVESPAATPTPSAPASVSQPASDAARPDKPLAGIVVCVDPGHQGRQNSDLEPVAPGSSEKKAKVSSGTAGVATREPEYELTLAVGLRLKALLEAQGAEVVMTRETHDIDISNAERAQLGNDAGADLSVRIHADGSQNSDITGISMQIPSAEHVGDEIAAVSESAGTVVLDGVIAATGAKNRGLYVRGDLTGFNWSTVPTILIEMGFMSNPDEDRLLATEAYRDRLAAGLCDGIVEYFTQ